MYLIQILICFQDRISPQINSSIRFLIGLTSGYLDIDFDSLNNDIIVSYSNKLIDIQNTFYYSYIQRFTLSENAQIYNLTRKNFNNLFLPIKDQEEHESNDTNGYKNYIIEGVKMKIVKSDLNTRVVKVYILQEKYK